MRDLKDGQPCEHRGCLNHTSHPCEGCGRISGLSIGSTVDYITTDVKNRLSNNLDTTNPRKIKSNITELLDKYVRQRLIVAHNATEIEVNILWNSWGFKEKLVWTICNKWFPNIAKDTRETIDELDDACRTLVENDTDVGYYSTHYPQWAIPLPRTIVVSNMEVQINQPLDFINVDIKI